MFVENTAAFLADFGVPARFVTSGAAFTLDSGALSFDGTETFDGGGPAQSLSATVLFDAPDTEVVGARAISREYRILFRTKDLPGIGNGSSINVNGQQFTVLHVLQMEDGVFSMARLEL